MNYSEAKAYAHQMRQNPTDAEKTLWQYLRKRQLGDRKFLRQHPIFIKVFIGESFYYIPDFYCYEAKLAIELDGSIHRFKTDIDARRDTILTNTGINVLRIENQDLNDIESVLERIKANFPE